MTTMAMAQAVFQHAHDFYDTGSWYVVAECWDVLAIAEHLTDVRPKARLLPAARPAASSSGSKC